MCGEDWPEQSGSRNQGSRNLARDFIFEVAFMLWFHNEFNESYRASLRPFGSVQNEQANQIKNLDLERVLTRKAPTWHYAVQMERGRKNMAQLARELEPLPSGWSEMNIGDAMHLLHLPETSSVTTSGLRQALEHALEHAKFDEIPVLLGAYRILEGHFGGPEAAATRQDDPTSASWPALAARTVSGPAGSGAVELDPWEDDPSITVSDIRMIEPASVTAGSSLQVAWFQAGNDPQQIVIDDFSLSQTKPLQAQASTGRRAPNVVKMHEANSPSMARAWRMSIPGLLAVGFAGLLVVWAYHPTAQGFVASVLGQPQPQAVVSESVLTTQVPQAEANVQTVPSPQTVVPAAVEAAPSVISSAPVMVRAPEPEVSTVNAESSLKSNSNEQALKPISSKPASSELISSKPASSRPTQIKPSSSKPVQTKSTSSVATKAIKPNIQTKPTVAAARQPIVSKPRTVARLKSNLNKPRASKPQPVLSQAKKVIQVVTNAVTQAPKATVGTPLRVSRQASSQSSSQTGRTTRGTRVSTNAAPKKVTPKTVTASSNPQVDTSITNPIKLASSNERDAAAARAIANPQPVSSIQVPKASGKIDNLSREDFGQRYFNRKLYEVWQRDGAKLRYGSWDSVPLELQILENDLFRSAIYLDGPSGNDAKDNEKPVQP
jgi:hypothetical protein